MKKLSQINILNLCVIFKILVCKIMVVGILQIFFVFFLRPKSKDEW